MNEKADSKTADTSPLGQATVYKSQYDKSLLFPIDRQQTRKSLFSDNLPFHGYDCWTAYELSWLDNSGKPVVMMAQIFFDCHSPQLIESKSLKLYLNSYNQTKFQNAAEVTACICEDLSLACGKSVELKLHPLDDFGDLKSESLPGVCIDQQQVTINNYQPNASLLKSDKLIKVEKEILYSHLLKTNCPVTGQPDWATLFIEYTGHKIQQASLLAYIISFREHQDFHEHCVEQIFADINTVCETQKLTVYARYTRRGGLDINPLRSNYEEGDSKLLHANLRTLRQ
jgi:7-cyano-7-deazaguanine reductase